MSEVSVIMSVYNGMPYLPEAVDSILNQTLKDFKFLIIDDGSEDGSKGSLNRLGDRRVQVVYRPHLGRSAARSFGLAMCDSEFSAIMDADDVALPSRLEAQLCFLRHHGDVGLVGTQIAYFAVAGRSGFGPPMPFDHETIYADLLRGRHALVNPTIMCRTSILKRIDGARIEGGGEDWDRMFLRMGETTKLANLKEVLYLQRLHSTSICARDQTKIQNHYAYVCDAARRRADGQPEITFDEFLIKQRAHPFWQRGAELMDIYALGQYRRALTDILSSHWARGYARLAYAALCSPPRTLQRISRAIRKRRK